MGNDSPSHKAVGIVSKPNKPEVAQIMPPLTEWLRSHGYTFIVDPETSPHAKAVESVSREEMAARNLDFIIVLGGDGTLLSAARAAAKAGIPFTLATGSLTARSAFAGRAVAARAVTDQAGK